MVDQMCHDLAGHDWALVSGEPGPDAIYECRSCELEAYGDEIPEADYPRFTPASDPDGPDRNGAFDGFQVISDADPGL
jgi:hypothetical protein